MVQKVDVVPVQNHPLFSIYFVRFFTQRSFSKIIFSVNLCSTKKDSFLKNVPENRYFSSLNDPSRVSSLKKNDVHLYPSRVNNTFKSGYPAYTRAMVKVG